MEEGNIPREVRTQNYPKITNLLAFTSLLFFICLNTAIVGLLCATLIVAYDRAFGIAVFFCVIGLHVATWILLHILTVKSKKLQRRLPALKPALTVSACIAAWSLLAAFFGFGVWVPVSNLRAIRIEAFDWVDPLTPGSLGGEVDPYEYVYFFGEGAYLPPLEEGIYGEKIRTYSSENDRSYCVFPVVATRGWSYVDPSSSARSVLINSAVACLHRSKDYDYDSTVHEDERCSSAVHAAENSCFENVARALLPSPSSVNSSSPSFSSSSDDDGPSVGLEGLVGLCADMFFDENHLLDVREFDMTLTRLRDTVRANGGRIADDVVLLALDTEEQFENVREEALIDFEGGVGAIGAILFCLFVAGSIWFPVWVAKYAVEVRHQDDVEMEELRKEARRQRVEHAWRLRDCGKDSEVMVVVEQMVVNNSPS